eukprot:443479-Amphidinium_carterae.2
MQCVKCLLARLHDIDGFVRTAAVLLLGHLQVPGCHPASYLVISLLPLCCCHDVIKSGGCDAAERWPTHLTPRSIISALVLTTSAFATSVAPSETDT